MADHGGIVTNLTALEEIASMKVLSSDKTGTLTTASMTVYYDHNCRTYNGFKAEEVLTFASIASNDANKDDPIDSAVLRAFAQSKGKASVDEAVAARKKVSVLVNDSFCGFNPIVKRTSASVTHGGKTYFCAKGMVDVILNQTLRTRDFTSGRYKTMPRWHQRSMLLLHEWLRQVSRRLVFASKSTTVPISLQASYQLWILLVMTPRLPSRT